LTPAPCSAVEWLAVGWPSPSGCPPRTTRRTWGVAGARRAQPRPRSSQAAGNDPVHCNPGPSLATGRSVLAARCWANPAWLLLRC
jgi:hypothetical protein